MWPNWGNVWVCEMLIRCSMRFPLTETTCVQVMKEGLHGWLREGCHGWLIKGCHGWLREQGSAHTGGGGGGGGATTTTWLATTTTWLATTTTWLATTTTWLATCTKPPPTSTNLCQTSWCFGRAHSLNQKGLQSLHSDRICSLRSAHLIKITTHAWLCAPPTNVLYRL